MSAPLITLKDGEVLGFDEWGFEGGGGCETCGYGGEPDTTYEVLVRRNEGKCGIEYLHNIKSSLVTTYVLRYLPEIKLMTVDGFLESLKNYCKENE